MRIEVTIAVLGSLTACQPATPEPTQPTPVPVTSVAPAPAVAPAPRVVPPPPRRAVPPSGDERPGQPTEYPEFAAQPDKPGKLVRKATAVLLISARGGVSTDPTDLRAERRFIPIACTIKGVFATGKDCGAVMPARATIRTPAGPLVVSRPTKVFHDEAGDQDFQPPYGPVCCTYNTCREATIPYTGTAKPEAQASRFGVWPADADLDLQISTTAPVQHDLHGLGQRANILLATTDIDGDGTRERTVYEVWANDFGIQVLPEHDDRPLYAFSCGNI